MLSFSKNPWERLEAEARLAFAGYGRFPLPAYSELMPPPYVGIKPYGSRRAGRRRDEGVFEVTEYEQAQELAPGLQQIAARVIDQLAKLSRGQPHELSRTLLDANAAWPAALAEAARRGALAAPVQLALALALSRTQDDKGNVRWTLFGVSHAGPAEPFWASFAGEDEERFLRIVGFCLDEPPPSLRGAVRVLAPEAELPAFARRLLWAASEPPSGVRALVTFRPFAGLPEPVQRAHLEGKLAIVPSPASLIFFEHQGYRRLAASLPRAEQIPLLHLFQRGGGQGIRIPQSGWLDESSSSDGRSRDGHALARRVPRTHRFQRTGRDEEAAC
jgi:hypothetical protein